MNFLPIFRNISIWQVISTTIFVTLYFYIGFLKSELDEVKSDYNRCMLNAKFDKLIIEQASMQLDTQNEQILALKADTEYANSQANKAKARLDALQSEARKLKNASLKTCDKAKFYESIFKELSDDKKVSK